MSGNKRLTAKQVADQLGFTTTNLKHYANLLEQNGLKIFRNTRNHREYTQHDVKILKAMQYLNKEKSMPLEDVASKVTEYDFPIDEILSSTQVVATIDANIPVLSQDSDNSMHLLTQLLTQQQVEIKALRDEIYMRDKLMIDFQSDITNKLETQSQLIIDQSHVIDDLKKELEEMRKDRKGKSFWSRFFSKNQQ